MSKQSWMVWMVLALPGWLNGQIALDQVFDDWANLPITASAQDHVHARSAQVTSNADWVFWRLELGEEIALDETIVPHNLQLWVDNDANVNTGWLQSGIGVDVLLDFAEGEVRRFNAVMRRAIDVYAEPHTMEFLHRVDYRSRVLHVRLAVLQPDLWDCRRTRELL